MNDCKGFVTKGRFKGHPCLKKGTRKAHDGRLYCKWHIGLAVMFPDKMQQMRDDFYNNKGG